MRGGRSRRWISRRRSRRASLALPALRLYGPGHEPGEAGHVGDQLASPSRAAARARPTERVTRPSRHFWAGYTCSIATRTRARLALPRARCGGIGLPRGCGRSNWAPAPRRANNAPLDAER